MTPEQITNELKKAYQGEPWHGDSLLSIIARCSAHKVFSHPVPGAHSVAEIVLHLTAWTREIISRLSGHAAGEPAMGDWPVAQEQTESYWNGLVQDLKNSNEELLRITGRMQAEEWLQPAGVHAAEAGGEITCFALVNGLIQHHAYHAGQISLLCKY
ncbi:DinB family protein [Pedobacter yulinensis]|nr:DinB family protein [Pedobacter yulinensis]